MQKCFVVLEPSNHLYKVIEAAAARGMHVVVFHNMPLSADGQYGKGLLSIGETHFMPSWADEKACVEEILRVLEGRPVAGTYAGFETVLLIDAELRTRFGLPSHGKPLLNKLMDKRWVRQQLRSHGLSDLDDFDPRAIVENGAWPDGVEAAYLKPISGTGSIHVTRCTDVAAVAAGLAAWDGDAIAYRAIQRPHLARGGGLFLEQAARGELMSLEGWVYGGKYHALGLTSRTVLTREDSIEMGATFPYEHPLREAIVAKIAAIHEALGLQHGATHTELMVDVDGTIELVELNVRFGGADLLLLVNFARNPSADSLLVDLGCGLEPEVAGDARQFTGYACMQQILPPHGTTSLDSIVFDEALIAESRILKKLGSAIASTDHQHDQVGAFIVRDASYAGVLDKARQVRHSVRINGVALEGDRNNLVTLR
jgi:hypothetical protein